MSPTAQQRLVEFSVVVLVLVVLIALLYPAVQYDRNPKGPHGRMLPLEPPDEANRVAHVSGISIVAPKNWDQVRERGPGWPSLTIAARGRPRARLKSIISIEETDLPDAAVLERATPLTFQGLPAYEHMEIVRKDTFDVPARSHYELYIKAPDRWWHVDFGVAATISSLPPSIRQYIDTIRLPPTARETEQPAPKPPSATDHEPK